MVERDWQPFTTESARTFIIFLSAERAKLLQSAVIPLWKKKKYGARSGFTSVARSALLTLLLTPRL